MSIARKKLDLVIPAQTFSWHFNGSWNKGRRAERSNAREGEGWRDIAVYFF